MSALDRNALPGLLLLNLLVYVVWHTVGPEHPELLRQHLLVSWESVTHGRLWTLLTAEFSHIDAMHLLANLLALWVFGRPVGQVLGGARLIALYVAGALSASVAFVVWAGLTGSESAALGASGAAMAFAVPYAMWFPDRTLLVMFVIPMRAWLAVLLFIGLDALGLLWTGVDGMLGGVPIAHSAHLGGALAGLVVGFPVWRRIRASRV
ncbi:MAG: rhomboid family intramembrane serine protease [Alphaproteobacteria bacterium]|nr:rhomboid family intramembrane serine protease [Alphaproteobacteria bacterium]